MNSRELNESYLQHKQKFQNYINVIKKSSPWDIYTIVNATLIKNPYTTVFPLRFFKKELKNNNLIFSFCKNIGLFYIKNIYLYLSFFIAFILYKIYYKKQRKNELKTIIDIFGLVDKTNKDGVFSEHYLTGIYDVFEKYNQQYTILLRLYGLGRNPFKLIKFLKIIREDKRDIIFEYEFLNFNDFLDLFILCVLYPFKTLRLIQKERIEQDKIFNESIIEDIRYFNLDSLNRYILGKNLSRIQSIEKIYSWSEFQVIERSFNYGVRKNNNDIKLIACQFYLNYESYFNTYIDDLDYDMLASPHEVLVNGQYYVLDRDKVKYARGVSLRYKNIFHFQGVIEEKNILLLGSYMEKDTQYMLESVKDFKNVIFKNHPAVDISIFGKLSTNIAISNENIYELFKNTKLVIGTASGTAVEAVACGISVIIIASQDNLTVNPLVEHGKGEIWDIAFSKDDVPTLYNKLLNYRKNNIEKIKSISLWYKENFFIEPTEEKIVKLFKLDKEKK